MKQKIFNVLIAIAVIVIAIFQMLTCLKEEKPPEIKIVEVEKQPNFFNKSPQDGLMETLEYYEIKHPKIVYAQAVLETGNFKSRIFKEYNNLFGLYNSSLKDYYKFEHWTESVLAYKNYVQYKYDSDNNYYRFLESINYAEDPAYINKIKQIVDKN